MPNTFGRVQSGTRDVKEPYFICEDCAELFEKDPTIGIEKLDLELDGRLRCECCKKPKETRPYTLEILVKKTGSRKGSSNICGECKKASDGRKCSWAYNFTPVEGWDASPTVMKVQYSVKTGNTGKNGKYALNGSMLTWSIRKCPLYEREVANDRSSSNGGNCPAVDSNRVRNGKTNRKKRNGGRKR